jgi:hypothetical protein
MVAVEPSALPPVRNLPVIEDHHSHHDAIGSSSTSTAH